MSTLNLAIIGVRGLGGKATSSGIDEMLEGFRDRANLFEIVSWNRFKSIVDKYESFDGVVICVGNSLGASAIMQHGSRFKNVFAITLDVAEKTFSGKVQPVTPFGDGRHLNIFQTSNTVNKFLSIEGAANVVWPETGHVLLDDREGVQRRVITFINQIINGEDAMTEKPFYMGEYKPLSDQDFVQIANEYGLTEAHVRAVVEVEVGPNGKGSHTSGALVCLYEPHVAYRNTSGKTRDALEKAGLAYPRWIRKYPKTSYPRIDECVEVVGRVRNNREAGVTIASLATSWGLGQILGENFKLCGYTSASEMVRDFAKGEVNQLRGMMEFVKNAGILDDLKAERWDTFARRYNGSQYAKHNYHGRLAKAFARWQDAIKDRGDIIVVNPVPPSPVPQIEDMEIDFASMSTAELGQTTQATLEVLKSAVGELEKRAKISAVSGASTATEGNAEMFKFGMINKLIGGVVGILAGKAMSEGIIPPQAEPIVDGVLSGTLTPQLIIETLFTALGVYFAPKNKE